jgi:hypothetical protein
MSFRSNGLLKIFLVCAVLVVGATLFDHFLPEVVSASWHLLHGNSVQLGPWEVPVPWGWRGRTVNDSVDVGRMETRTQDEETVSDVIVGNLNLPVGTAIDSEKWKSASIEESLKHGYRFLSENNLRLDREVGQCLTFASVDHPKRLQIHCIFPTHGLDIQYIGSEAHSSALNSIIEGIKVGK